MRRGLCGRFSWSFGRGFGGGSIDNFGCTKVGSAFIFLRGADLLGLFCGDQIFYFLQCLRAQLLHQVNNFNHITIIFIARVHPKANSKMPKDIP
jgi:hypothetical protein